MKVAVSREEGDGYSHVWLVAPVPLAVQVDEEGHEAVRVVLGDGVIVVVGVVAAIARFGESHDEEEARESHVRENQMAPIALQFSRESAEVFAA